MTDTERRRKRLLEETRRKYSEERIPPAVHPRYSAIYSDLYYDEEENGKSGSFGVRLFLAVLLFAAFIALDNRGENIAKVDSRQIVEEIKKQPAIVPSLY